MRRARVPARRASRRCRRLGRPRAARRRARALRRRPARPSPAWPDRGRRSPRTNAAGQQMTVVDVVDPPVERAVEGAGDMTTTVRDVRTAVPARVRRTRARRRRTRVRRRSVSRPTRRSRRHRGRRCRRSGTRAPARYGTRWRTSSAWRSGDTYVDAGIASAASASVVVRPRVHGDDPLDHCALRLTVHRLPPSRFRARATQQTNENAFAEVEEALVGAELGFVLRAGEVAMQEVVDRAEPQFGDRDDAGADITLRAPYVDDVVLAVLPQRGHVASRDPHVIPVVRRGTRRAVCRRTCGGTTPA